MTECRTSRWEQKSGRRRREGEVPSNPRVRLEEGDWEERRSEQTGHVLGRAWPSQDERQEEGFSPGGEDVAVTECRTNRPEQKSGRRRSQGEAPCNPEVKPEEGDQEEKRSKQTGYILGRAWPSQIDLGHPTKKIDQFTSPGASGGPQTEGDDRPQSANKSSATQILVAIEASGLVVEVKIEAMALDMNLLRTDLHKVAKWSVEMENQVSEEVSQLKAAVAVLEAPRKRPYPGDPSGRLLEGA
ncbi:hypothetical protein NDU88_009132 [Pleurodeles waltl]|uniref:Uncharacterized protein n=1 Tax=Pleurodeles waltl TaxID=8319 RepID=A0AAV7RWS2_PLEWA|nr:hypothetical protein NDU88_009132 [Pleurodeles waltl]